MANMADNVSWDKYSQPIIDALNLKESSKDEFHGACPHCGGTDRFWINKFEGKVKTHCRRCNDFAAINDTLRDQGLLPKWKPVIAPAKAAPNAPYHKLKKLDLSLDGCRLDGDKLIVTLCDIITGKEIGTQTITNAKKVFSKGLKKEGAGAFIGQHSETLVITEGYATAQAVHLATGYQVLFALDATTVPKNVALLQKHDPTRKLIVAADADAQGEKAVEKAGVTYSLPTQKGDDWNDVFVRDGAVATATQFEQNIQTPGEKAFDLGGFNIISAEALARKTFEPIEFLVPDLLPSVGLTMISGAPKVGKSYFCLNLISQFASDCGVLYLANEDNERRLQARNEQIFPFGPPPNLMLLAGLSSENPLPRGDRALEFIQHLKRKYPKVGCVFIDTVAGIRERTGKDKGYETTEAEFGALRKLSHELKIAVVAVHHNKKVTESDLPPLEQILGSQGIAATVETALIMMQAPGSQDVNLFATGKDIEQQEIRYKWENPGFMEAGDAVEAALGPFQRQCLNYIRQHPRCMQTAIVQNTAHAKSSVSEAIKKLGEKGLIFKDDSGKLIATAK
jgi:hypothetical protein